MISKIKKILIYFFEICFFLIEIFLFKFRKKNTPGSYNTMLRLFYFSGGMSNDFINFFVSKKPKQDLVCHEGLLSKFDNKTKKKFLNKLNENGYVIIKNVLMHHEIKNLLRDFKNKDGYYISDNITKKVKQKLNIEKPKAVKFYYSSQDIINTKSFHKILFDPSLIYFAQEYLKYNPIIDNISSWWSFPSEYADKNAAQWWHFDLERPKWLKFFFFLTDCTLETGAHSFIRGSQKNNGINWSLRRRGYERLSDSEVKKFYDKKDIINVVAKKGSLLIEDTRGLHKGNNLIKDNRFLIQVQYSSSTFGAKIENFKFPKLKEKKLKYIKEKFKYTYSLFN